EEGVGGGGGEGGGEPGGVGRNRPPGGARERPPRVANPGVEEVRCSEQRQLPAVVGRRAPKETEAGPRGPKPPRWSAERRASRVMGNYRSMGLHINPRLSALPPM